MAGYHGHLHHGKVIVNYYDQDARDRALRILDGQLLLDRPVRLKDGGEHVMFQKNKFPNREGDRGGGGGRDPELLQGHDGGREYSSSSSLQHQIIVRNLPYATDEEDLVRFIKESSGIIAEAHIVRTPEGKAHGWAKVRVMTKAHARAVLHGLRGKLFGGREIDVSLDQRTSCGPGRYGISIS